MKQPTPISFKTPAAFRAWLKKNQLAATELVIRLYKVHAADRGITYKQALDEALCFGWIDGVRRSLDANSFTVRFTPRKPHSIWSRVNVAHVERLAQAGRMTPSGLAAFAAREEHRTGVYSFERPPATLSPGYLKTFRENESAWRFFETRPPWYRRTSIHWVMSAKKEQTRNKRLAILVECSSRCATLPQLTRNPK